MTTIRAGRRRFFFIVMMLLPMCAIAQTWSGNLTGVVNGGRSILLLTDGPDIRLTFITPDILRIDLLPTPSSQPDSSFAVVQDTTAPLAAVLSVSDSLVLFSSGELTASCTTTPLRLSVVAGGKTILEEAPEGGVGFQGAARYARFTVDPDEHFYGTGERATSLDLRGQAFDLYNTQQYGYGSPPATMNINVPFVARTRGAGLFFDSYWPGRFDLASGNPTRLSYATEGGELSFYVLSSQTVQGQLALYTWLTGRQPLPPIWAFGYLQSKFGYHNEVEARSIVAGLRQHRIPCDALILDLYWYGDMGDLDWDRATWPDPATMMADFLSLGIHTVVITQPYLTTGSAHFAAGSALGHLAKNSGGSTYLLPNWWYMNSTASLVDLTSPAARAWWWSKHPAFFGSYLAGVWTDLGEPERHPEDMVHALGGTRKVHNLYNFLWSKTIAEGFANFRPGQRLFNLTRSGFAGSQRFGVITWSGDVAKSFGGLSMQIPILLSMGLSGFAYHNSDIGGFAGPPTSPELYIRWLQFGTFCPITRAHGSEFPTEPWAFGAQAEEIARSFLELRYRLLPYIYSAAAENYRTGLPIVRPLFFEDPTRTQDASSYLFGDAFLVSPVIQGSQTSKTVFLPEGEWIDFWTDRSCRGATTLPTPLETMPLFVRAGSVIPMRTSRTSTSDQPADTLLLAVYPSRERLARCTLYEDDGATTAYQSGAFASTEFIAEVDGQAAAVRITLGISTGTYAGKPAGRNYLLSVHQVLSPPLEVRKGETNLPRLSSPALLTVNEGYYFDSLHAIISISVSTDTVLVVTLDHPILADVSNLNPAPMHFTLEQNYPNPFNPSTAVRFQLSALSKTRIAIYDLLGREIKVLVDEFKPAGIYEVTWDASGFSSGAYICRMTAGRFSSSRRILLIR